MKPRVRAALAGAIALAVVCTTWLIWREGQTRKAAAREAESDHLAQDFAEVGQCFFAEQPKTEEITFRKLANISARLDGTGSHWPFDCRKRIDQFRTRVETAHGLDKTSATRLSSALYKLDEYLRDGDIQMVQLSEHLAAVWTHANACGIGSATPETAAPPLPRVFPPGTSKLAIQGLEPLDGGRSWQFLGSDAQGFGLCGQDGVGLVCRRIAAGAVLPDVVRRLRTRGSWSSPRFVPLASSDALWLLADLKLERLPLSPNDVVSSHVGANGELRAVTRGERKEWQLFSRSFGGTPTTTKISDLLSKLDRPLSAGVQDVRMLGGELLVVGPSSEVDLVALAPDGTATAVTKLELTSPPYDGGSTLGTCRAGPFDAISVSYKIAFDTPKGIVTHPRELKRCSAAGVVWAEWGGCTPTGCTDYPETIFQHDGGRSFYRNGLARDRVGTGDTIAWTTRLEAGLVVRGNAADLSTAVAVASGDELAERGPGTMVDLLNGEMPGPTLGVYGGPNGGVVLYRNGAGPQLGVAVDAAGAVMPLSIEWRETPLP